MLCGTGCVQAAAHNFFLACNGAYLSRISPPHTHACALAHVQNVPNGMDFAYEATVIWDAPASTGKGT